MSLNTEFKLSLYEELKLLHKSRKGEIFLVQNVQDDKIYIKKEIKEYTKDVYENIRTIESINIPKIYDIFEMNDKLIVIEEFVNGNTLQSILENEKKLNEERVIGYMISLCEALDKVHNLKPPIIHRDIKPANIIISNDNVLKLIDFDIARTYKEGENIDTTLLGTKGYASPEQFGFDQTDCRSDIYALGIMMNVLTTGKHVKEELNNTLLKDIIKKCTNISASERYPNVIELKKELEFKLYNEERLNLNKGDNSKILIENNYNPSKIKNNKRKNTLKVIPGFRSGRLANKILSSLFYGFLVFALFIGENIKEFLENIVIVIMLLTIFLTCTNFLGIKDKIPIIKSKNRVISIFGYILYFNILVLIVGSILNLLQ